MDEEFHVSERVSKADIQALQRRSDRPGITRFALQYGAFLAATGVVVVGPELALPAWTSAAGVAVFALSVMGLFASMHESAHGTAFASRRLNRVACWLTAAPFYYTPTGFREFHFTHHRHTHDPHRDPEISAGGEPAPGIVKSVGMYVAFMSGLPLIVFKVGLLIVGSLGGPPAAWRLFGFVAPKARRRLGWEARAVLALHVLWLGAGVAWLPGLLDLYAGQLIGHTLLAWYLVAEHNGLPHTGDILQRTRTMRPGAALGWLMWNMPFHAEHHAYPAVPFHALPALHDRLRPPHTGGGYFAFHLRVIGALARGRPFTDN